MLCEVLELYNIVSHHTRNRLECKQGKQMKYICTGGMSNPTIGGGGDERNMSPFPEEVSSKEPLPRKYFNKLLLE